MTSDVRLLWLTPDKPDNISVGRSQIARSLEASTDKVTVRGTTPATLLETLLEWNAYDVVIGTTRAGAIAGLIVSFTHRVPLIVDHVDPISQFRETHSSWLARFVETAENLAFAHSSATMFVYEEERARVENHASVALKTDLGVDYDRFADPDTEIRAAGHDLLPADAESPIAVYVGGLEPIYNVETMLAAGSNLDSGSLVIAGTGSLSDTVKRTADRSNSVYYLGTISHEIVPGLLAACDVGVSLVNDPYTLKVLEYGAAGLPVVQLDGRARDRFSDRVIYVTADAQAVADAISSAADCEGDRLQSYVAQFDWENIAATYADAIKMVC